MPQKSNAPGHKAEGVVCLHSQADTDAYATEARFFQQLRTRLPILTAHVGIERLASLGEARHA